MANGLSSPDSAIGIRPTEIKAPERQNFTRLPEFQKPTITELPKYEEPTMTVSPQDKELTDQLLAKIMNQEKPKKPQEVISQIEKKISQEKKSQGFLAQIIEWFKTTFKNLFR